MNHRCVGALRFSMATALAATIGGQVLCQESLRFLNRQVATHADRSAARGETGTRSFPAELGRAGRNVQPAQYAAHPVMDEMVVVDDGYGQPWDVAQCDGCLEGCDACCPPTCAPRWAWTGGADYLFVRPTFSEAIAFVESEFSSEGANLDQTRHPYDFDHQSAVRAFLGYRWCDCDAELLFTYTNLDGHSTAVTDAATANRFFTGQLEINTAIGQSLTSTAAVDVDNYDVTFSKTIFLGRWAAYGPDGCDPCAPWQLTWSAGARVAAVDLEYGSVIRDVESGPSDVGHTEINARGAGPIIGLAGRRYFGPAGMFWAYAQGNIALLLSDYEINSSRFVSGSTPSTQRETAELTRLLPATELEVGAACRFAPGTTLAGGYLLHAWHDMGITQGIGGNLPAMDSANILSFDGFFVRGTFTY